MTFTCAVRIEYLSEQTLVFERMNSAKDIRAHALSRYGDLYIGASCLDLSGSAFML
jgi:hypothetical protein